MTVTLLSIFRRREGMSHDEFVEYYETFHARIGEKVLAGYASAYRRRFTTPLAHEAGPSDPDVVMEIEFPDEETMQAFFASIANDAESAEMIRVDEDKLFDRDSMKVYRIDERVSEMPPVG